LLSYEAIPLSADKVLSGIELALSRSWPRGARYFCLDTKVPKKSSQQGGFFALTHSTTRRAGLCPAKRSEPRAAIILPRFAHTCPTLPQKLAMPLPSLKATIVPPIFARSLPADEERLF